jgi:Transposase DDE domain group 1
MTYAMSVRQLPRPPVALTLDIDDTVDVVHGHQQLSSFKSHCDEGRLLPIHVYETATSCPAAGLLRPGKTPSEGEVPGCLRRLVHRIRSHWPTTRRTIRGDGHYSRPEVMAWCEVNDVDYGAGPARQRRAEPSGRDRCRRSPGCVVPKPRRRCYAATPRSAMAPNPGAASGAWRHASRPATGGLDVRYIEPGA